MAMRHGDVNHAHHALNGAPQGPTRKDYDGD